MDNMEHAVNLKLYSSSILLFILGIIFIKILSSLIDLALKFFGFKSRAFIFRKVFTYTMTVSLFIACLNYAGVNLKVLLGAAGVFTVAIGFASQTSASNLISGIFLLAEKPFSIGDFIQVGEVKGFIISIDLMSSRLRTLDNLLVRVPNETLMKSTIINTTYFPIRRTDLFFVIDINSNLAIVEHILYEISLRNPQCLHEPKPIFMVSDITDLGVKIQFSVWTKRENILSTKNQIYLDSLTEFKKNKIQLPTIQHRKTEDLQILNT